MSDPTVSVIVATNRLGPFLSTALQSVAQQTWPNIETIVVDDGSDDPRALAAMVERFGDVRIVRQANAGAAVARNHGVSVASGELIAFLDDDDVWAPTRIEAHVEAHRADPAAVASYCGMRIVDASGSVVHEPETVVIGDKHDVLRRKAGIITPTIVVRRDAYERVGGFHPGFRRAQDLDLVLKLALDGGFVAVPERLVDYRNHDDNVTRNHRELARSIHRIVSLHRWAAQERGWDDLVADHDVSLEANARFAWWSAMRAARSAARRGRAAEAIAEVAWAARFAPGGPASAVRRRLKPDRTP